MIDINIEAEQALLGALLIDPETWSGVSDVFSPAMFGVPPHRKIAEAMQGLIAARQPVDPVVLSARLEQAGCLGGEVPHEMPWSLARGLGSASNARVYAETVRSLWIKRRVKEEARQVLEDQTAIAGEELAQRLVARLAGMETAKRKPAQRLGEVVLDRIDVLGDQAAAAARGEKPPLTRIPTGFARLDRVIGGLGIGFLSILAARPQVGKSAFVGCLAEQVAMAGDPVYVFQLEDYADSLADRAITRRARVNSMLLRDGSRLNGEAWERINSGLDGALNWPIWVDDQHGLTPLDVVGLMRRAKKDYGIRLFVVDNLSELNVWGIGGPDLRHDQRLGMAARLLRDTAKELDAALLVLVHLSRDIEKRGEDSEPRLSDLKNSGEIEDAAHLIAFLQRPEAQPGLMVVDVAKHRDGAKGKVYLNWVGQYMAVENPKDAY